MNEVKFDARQRPPAKAAARAGYTALVAILTAAAVSMPFCSMASAAVIPAGVQLDAKQQMVRNNGSEVETLDPNLAESVPANNVMRDLFEGVTATDAQGHIVPGVAESWERKDPTTWIFHLRKNARWSNGEALVAGDFVYGIQRLVDPKTASTYGNIYGVFLVNGKDIVAGKKPLSSLGVSALDAHTLEVKTPYPVPFLPEMMSNTNLGPLNKAEIDKYGADWTKPGKLVSNGAYLLKDWQVNNKLVVSKNPNYWDAANVTLTQITFLPIEDENADVKMFQAGDNDFVNQVPAGSYAKLKQQDPDELHASPVLALSYYSLNTRDPLLKDVRVRQALTMVLDREILAQRVMANGQLPAYGLIIKGVEGADVTAYDWASWPMAKRVDEAKKLLAAAGVKPGTKIQFAMNTSEINKKAAIFAASEWKSKLGLDTEIESMEFKVLLKRRHDGEYQIARNGWVADYNDASTFLTLIACGSDQNDSGYCNPKIDALMAQATLAKDADSRRALQTQAARLAMDDYPIVPLLQYATVRLVKKYVGGYMPENALDHRRSKDMYIIKH